MATNNRAALFAKAHKTLKKYYTPIAPPERPVLEHLLFACLLENTHHDQAEKAFHTLKTGLFDWNEVRVSTVKELAEMVPHLPDAMTNVGNLRKLLFAVFESQYSYDLESFKKLNLGVAQQRIQKYNGSTPFVVGYATQVTLGGHCIPLDRGALQCLDVLVELTDKEKKEWNVSGLERAIPKNKGIEFGSLLHELGADMFANPMSTNLHKILLEINSDCKDRLPKRQPKKEEPPPARSGRGGDEKSKGAAASGKKPHIEGAKPSSAVKPPAAAKPAHAAKPILPMKPAHSGKSAVPAKPQAKKEPAKETPKKPAALQKRKPK